MGFRNLTIQNYQAHRDRYIELQPGVTSIVGPTDSGKSAIVRALRWLCLNQPAGTAHISHGAKGCTVAVTIEDGGGEQITVARIRDSKRNIYGVSWLTEAGEHEETWAAVKTTVPPGVQDILCMPSVCFQGQHDSPLWLADNGGEVAAAINQVVDLGVIDLALESAGGHVYQARAAVQAAQLSQTRAQEAVDSLAWVPEAVEAWYTIEALQEKLEALRARYKTLEATVSNLEDAHTRYTDLAHCAQAARQVWGAARETIADQDKVLGLLALRDDLRRYQAYVGLPEAVEAVLHTLGLVSYQELKEQELANALANIHRAAVAHSSATAQVTALTQELQTTKLSSPEVCPSCLRPL